MLTEWDVCLLFSMKLIVAGKYTHTHIYARVEKQFKIVIKSKELEGK